MTMINTAAQIEFHTEVKKEIEEIKEKLAKLKNKPKIEKAAEAVGVELRKMKSEKDTTESELNKLKKEIWKENINFMKKMLKKKKKKILIKKKKKSILILIRTLNFMKNQ